MVDCCRMPRRAAFLLASLSLLAAPALAQGRKLSGPLARPLGGDVLQHDVSPDGTRVVYEADEETDGVYSLYSVRPGGAGARVELASSSALARISDWRIGPLGRNVVFSLSDQASPRISLHVVPIEGGASREIAEGGIAFLVDAAERWVVFTARAPSGARSRDLWAVPLAGGAPVQLNPQAGELGVRAFDISPDGRRAVFVADTPGGPFELYSAPIGGGSLVKLSPGFEVESDLLVLDPRGLRVVFANERLAGPGNTRRLYSAPLRGALPAVELFDGFVMDPENVRVSPDGRRVIARRSVGGSHELASVPITGGPVVLLRAETWVNAFARLELTPDSRLAVFEAQPAASTEHVLFAAQLDGSSPALELARSFGAGVEITTDSQIAVFQSTSGLASVRVDGSAPPVVLASDGRDGHVSPDGSRVLYRAPVEGTNGEDLLSVPIAGGVPTPINAVLPFDGTVREGFLFSASTRRVVYVASQAARDQFELFSAPIDGGFAAVRLNRSMPAGPVEGDVWRMQPTADGRHVVYLADQDEDHRTELYAVRSDGRGAPVKRNEDLGPGELVFSFALTPDSTRIVYRIERPAPAPTPILVTPVAGGPSVELSTALRSGSSLHVDPTGSRAVFRAEAAAGDTRLFSVPLDASTPPVELSGARDPSGMLFTSDGSLVVFAGEGAAGPGVYSARLDGSASAVRLDAVAGGSGATQRFEIAATGGRVLFTNDAFAAGRYELFSALLDGSAAPVRLNGALTGSTRVWEFASAADGFAYYLADQAALGRREVFRAPLDGSAAATRISATLVSGGSVWRFVVSPDGARVVYVADQEAVGKSELYGVAGDGSGAVSKLSPPLGPGGDVGTTTQSGFDVAVLESSPDGSHVAFTAGLASRNDQHLFVARTDGSAPALDVASGPRYGDFGLAVTGLRFAPDGASVVYGALHSFSAGFALYHAPVDRARSARRVSGLGDGESDRFRAIPFSIAADGGRVVYLSDQETDEVEELFSSGLSLDFRGGTR